MAHVGAGRGRGRRELIISPCIDHMGCNNLKIVERDGAAGILRMDKPHKH